MIRCNNCGWSNTNSNVRCEKCNAPLKGSMVDIPKPEPESPPSEPNYYPPTQAGQSATGGFLDQHNVKNCPYCGYPNSIDTQLCINCKKSLIFGQVNDPIINKEKEVVVPENDDIQKIYTLDKKGKMIRVIEGDGANLGQQIIKGTVDPYRQIKEVKCYLEPIVDGENNNKVLIECIGTNLKLNREGLEPGNNTITSKNQAVINYSNGKFTLEDKSEQQTTFIQLNKPHILSNGDIILMGNRKFRFLVEE